MEIKKARTQMVVLPVLVDGEVTTYGVQALFTLGTKQGETPHQKWSITRCDLTIEEANEEVEMFAKDGYSARIVKITTNAKIIESIQ